MNLLLQSLLPSVIASMISILFFGLIAFCIRKKITNYLENKFLPDFLERLKAKEEAKSNVQHNTWKKQQLWEVKKEAYNSIYQCLLKIQMHIERRLEESKHYQYVFIEHCGYLGVSLHEGYSDSQIDSYIKETEQEIDFEKKQHFLKYKTKDVKNAENARSKQDFDEINKLSLRLKSEVAYLDKNSQPLLNFITELLKDNFHPEMIDPDDDIQEVDFWEHIIAQDEEAIRNIENKLLELEQLRKKEIDTI